MKILLSLVLTFCGAVLTNAQACGFTQLRIYLKDASGSAIKSAVIKTFDKTFKNENFLYINQSQIEKSISWEENKQSYFGREGICGGHRDVGLRISAKGFETLDNIINLPLGWTVYAVKLKRTGTNELPQIEKLIHIAGEIFDENKALIPSANIIIKDQQGNSYKTESDGDGSYDIDLPSGDYTAQISKNGFRDLKIINFQIEAARIYYLDLTLKVRGCDDCIGDILGENDGKDREEVVLDYQTIKRKNNK